MNDETNDSKNKTLHQLLDRGCWHDGEAEMEEMDGLRPMTLVGPCSKCGEKRPTTNPDYCSPDSPRKLLDEVEATVIETAGDVRYLRELLETTTGDDWGYGSHKTTIEIEVRMLLIVATATASQRVDACIEVLTEK